MSTASGAGLADLYAYSLVFTYDPKLLKFDANSSTGPDGGFSVESGGDGTVVLTDTRLGTSPVSRAMQNWARSRSR